MSSLRRPPPGVLDRLLAWVVTGPVGRGIAFALDLGAALAGAARERFLGRSG